MVWPSGIAPSRKREHSRYSYSVLASPKALGAPGFVRSGDGGTRFFYLCQIAQHRACHHAAVGVEARAVTWAIPGALGPIPPDYSAEVWANRGTFMTAAGIVYVYRDPVNAAALHHALAGLEGSDLTLRSEPISILQRYVESL